jgi:hypothetical protein
MGYNTNIASLLYMKKILSIAGLGLFLCIGEAFAQDAISVSISPLSALDMALSNRGGGQPLEYLWLEFDINYLADDNLERSVGAIIQPNFYALRYQQRQFSRDDHTGFLYGIFGRIEYREMIWEPNGNDGVYVSTTWFKDGGGTIFRSIGAIFGGDVGFRLRGERFGATFYAGAGLPLFYCFGNLPPDDKLTSLYLSSALIKALNLGIKFDFYL